MKIIEIERRNLRGIEVRTAKSGAHTLAGYAAKYNVRAQLPGFVETIATGAFRKILASKPDVRFLANHDASQIYGRTKAGTLRLSEDGTGLFYEVDLPATRSADELWTSVQRGDISGSSFSFGLQKNSDDEWGEERADDGSRTVLRTIHNFSDLMDVSAVTFPAYHDATVEARGKRGVPDRIKRQFEHVAELRRHGSKLPIWRSPLAEFVKDVDHSAEIARRRSALLNIILN